MIYFTIIFIINKILYYRRFQNSVVQCRSLNKKITAIFYKNFKPVKVKCFPFVISYDFLRLLTIIGFFITLY